MKGNQGAEPYTSEDSTTKLGPMIFQARESSLMVNTPPLANLLRSMIAVASIALSIASGRPDLGTYIGFLMLVLHFRTTRHLLAEYKTTLITMILGSLVSAALQQLQLIEFAQPSSIFPFPGWLLVLFAILGTTLNSALSSLRTQLMLASLAGAGAGSAGLWVLSSTGIILLLQPQKAYLITALGSAILLPTLSYAANYFTLHCNILDSKESRP